MPARTAPSNWVDKGRRRTVRTCHTAPASAARQRVLEGTESHGEQEEKRMKAHPHRALGITRVVTGRPNDCIAALIHQMAPTEDNQRSNAGTTSNPAPGAAARQPEWAAKPQIMKMGAQRPMIAGQAITRKACPRARRRYVSVRTGENPARVKTLLPSPASRHQHQSGN